METLVYQSDVVLTCKVVRADAIITLTVLEVFLPTTAPVTTKSAIALETIIATSLSLPPTEDIVC